MGKRFFFFFFFFDRIPVDTNIDYCFLAIFSVLLGSTNRTKREPMLNKTFKLLQKLKSKLPRSVNNIMLNSTDFNRFKI